MKNTLRKSDLIKLVSEDCGYYLYEVEDVMESLLKIMSKTLCEGHKVQLDRLMTLYAPHNEVRQYWDASSSSMKTSKGIRKLKVSPSVIFKKLIESHDLEQGEDDE